MAAKKAKRQERGKGDRGAGPERLQKILARAGYASRRGCEGIITDGRVAVNGEIVIELGTKADPSRDTITVDGKRVRAERTVYYVVNKPRGAISTTAKDAKRRVIDLVPPRPRVNPVGRLDVDSEGLMLLTNDGDLTHRMTHPKYGLERVYRTEVRGDVTDRALAKLRRGVRLAEGKTLPPNVRVVRRGPGGGTLELTLREGLNREVRRMLAAVGLKVRKLARTRLGPLSLGKLASGESRKLTAGELAKLREAVAGPGRKPPKWLRRRRPGRGGPRGGRD
jgi:pseudouridine synthase